MPESAECIANLSEKERRKRLLFGVVTGIVSLFAIAALVLTGVDRWWRLLLFFTYWAVAIGYFQWREWT
jgi:hypothetical protein